MGKWNTYGAGSVENLEHTLLIVDFDLFAITVFDCWIIFFYEDSLHELDGLEKKNNKDERLGERTEIKENQSLTRALLPTPPLPRTTILYSLMLE